MLRGTRRAVALPAAMLAFAAAFLAVPLPAAAAQRDVQVADSAFSPGNLVVQVGDTVTWTNADDRPHTVTASDGSFDSGNLDEGGSFSFTFTEPGTYTYRCEYHPDMQATIVVEAAPAAPAEHRGGAQHRGAGNGAGGGGSIASGDQPDTALPGPGAIPGLSLVLWGLALVVLAITVLPGRKPVGSTVDRPRGGWRR